MLLLSIFCRAKLYISKLSSSLSDRLDETWVLVSDEERPEFIDQNVCKYIKKGDHDVVSVKCDYKDVKPPRRGRYVMLWRSYVAYEHVEMNICEVQVLSCPPGSWGISMNTGRDCSRNCSNCANPGETCGVSDGLCYSGCKDGWLGTSCDQELGKLL